MKRPKSDIVKTLRDAGVPLITMEQAQEAAGQPHLQVSVITHDGGHFGDGETVVVRLSCYCIRMDFRETGILARDKKKTEWATTWGLLSFGAVEQENLAKEVRKQVKILANGFATDYVVANPMNSDPHNLNQSQFKLPDPVK